VTKGLW